MTVVSRREDSLPSLRHELGSRQFESGAHHLILQRLSWQAEAGIGVLSQEEVRLCEIPCGEYRPPVSFMWTQNPPDTFRFHRLREKASDSVHGTKGAHPHTPGPV